MTTEIDTLWDQFSATLTPGSARRYMTARRYLSKFRGPQRLADIDQRMLVGLAEFMCRRRLKAGAVRNYFSMLRRFLRWACEQGHISTNPLDGVRVADVVDRQKGSNFLRFGEAEAAIEDTRGNVFSPRDRAVFCVMLYMGAGPREAGSLRLNDLDLKKRRIRLGDRWRTMPDRLHAELKAYVPWRRQMFDPLCVYLFPSNSPRRKLGPLTASTIGKIMVRYGFRFTSHEWRDAYAVHELAKGTPLWTVHVALGNRSLATTAQYEPQLALIEAAEALSGSLRRMKTAPEGVSKCLSTA